MKIIFDNFKLFKEEKPIDFQTCLILWDGEKRTEIMLGIYYSDKKAFFDGIGSWFDEKYVRLWTDVNNYKVSKEIKH